VTKRFYGELFGWTAHETPEPEARGYTIFNRDGQPVAGAGPLFSDDQLPAWSTYVATDDADAAAGRVESAGGKTLSAPFDVLDLGRMAVFLDQAGAPFSVWQSRAMVGATRFNVPGSLTWNELTTPDPEGSKPFYGAVFGWTAHDIADGPVTYTMWRLDGKPVAGMMPMVGDEWPADLRPHWMVYFAVDNCDTRADQAANLGGVISVPPVDTPRGRLAVLNDPHGAVFSIIKANPV
jgi:uncharacterized protein